ncbi:MAG: hypothetical protein K6T27_09940 [Thermoleophilum sp.]|nr:hypothetical protein [Thermoleophilum sp.]
MSTTLEELRRRVLANLQRSDGQAIIAADQAINDAHKVIARVRDFDELIVLDTTHASTSQEVKTYHIIEDWGLVRPKDIYTIRYIDGANSRKLEFVPVRELDSRIPYPEMHSKGRPRWYTLRGLQAELFPIPDASKPLYILHSQWPPTLSKDCDVTPYLNLDDVIVSLATSMASAFLEKTAEGDWLALARALLGDALAEEASRPDRVYIHQPFTAKAHPYGKYWLDPWVKRQP